MLISYLKVKVIRKLSALHYSLSRLGLPFEGINRQSSRNSETKRSSHSTSLGDSRHLRLRFHISTLNPKKTQNSRLCISICSNASMPFSSPSQRIPGAAQKILQILWSKKLAAKLEKKSCFFLPSGFLPFPLGGPEEQPWQIATFALHVTQRLLPSLAFAMSSLVTCQVSRKKGDDNLKKKVCPRIEDSFPMENMFLLPFSC